MAKDGKTKDVKSWKATWQDNKTAVSQKVAKNRANQTATGNTGCPLKLAEREQKILGIIGFDYVEGVQCPDAFPEEQSNAIELLHQGQENILETAPITITIRSDSNTINLIDSEVPEIEGSESNIFEPTPQILHLETEVRESPMEELQMREKQAETSQARKPHATVSQTFNRIQKSAGHPRQNAKLGTQLMNAREDFATLAERQITCMEIFAKAMEKIADNDKERNAILHSLIEHEKAREKTYLDLTQIIKDCVKAMKGK